MPGALFARLRAQQLRAEAAIRRGDAATVEKRVADHKAIRGQMAPWMKALPPDVPALWDAAADELVARGRASAEKKPSAATQKKVVAALEKLEKLDHGGSSGPAWLRTTRERLGEWLLASGKPKEALAAFDRELAVRPNRALSLLGAARAAKAAGEAATAAERYRALADLWREADADLGALAEVRAGAGDAPATTTAGRGR
jgi:tetratricopeptide (TPR) repeat protein